MSNHAWCSDIPRDAAVRAAEDNRQGPLPTLEQCIETARAMMPKSVSATSAPKHENKGNGMRTERVTLEVTHDLDAPLGDWLVQLLDETRGYDESVRVVEECCLDRINMGEVIRERDAAIRERDELRGERDKAIREREEFRRSFHWSEEAGTRLLAERNASFDDADGLRARVAELESVPAASGNSQAILDGLGSTPPSAAGTELPTE